MLHRVEQETLPKSKCIDIPSQSPKIAKQYDTPRVTTDWNAMISHQPEQTTTESLQEKKETWLKSIHRRLSKTWSLSCSSSWGLIAGSLIAISGCAMCCGPHDYDYPNYGGKHERYDATYGRVGSVFSDPYANHGDASPDLYPAASTDNRGGASSVRQPLPEPADDPDELRQRLQRDLEDRRPTRPQPEQLPNPDNETANQSHWRFR